MVEVDRVLRPGGYWILSGPPINWRTNYKAWQRTKEDLEAEQSKIEEVASLLCWEKVSEKGEIAIWRKRVNDMSCPNINDESTLRKCLSTDPDGVWYGLLLLSSMNFSLTFFFFNPRSKFNIGH